MTHTQSIIDIYHVAVTFSRDTRRQVIADLTGIQFDQPADVWQAIAVERSQDGSREKLQAAAQSLIDSATPTALPYVRVAVKKLLAAVKDLADFEPEYHEQVHVVPASIAKRMELTDRKYTTWAPTAASVAELDELRNHVRVALIALDSLFHRYETPAARLLDVAKRIAAVVLEPTAAKLVGDWLNKLERP